MPDRHQTAQLVAVGGLGLLAVAVLRHQGAGAAPPRPLVCPAGTTPQQTSAGPLCLSSTGSALGAPPPVPTCPPTKPMCPSGTIVVCQPGAPPAWGCVSDQCPAPLTLNCIQFVGDPAPTCTCIDPSAIPTSGSPPARAF